MIYYCTTGNTDGTLLDNWVHGENYVTTNLYPSNYPTNPRTPYSHQTGYEPLVFITNLSGITWSNGDYIKVQIIGSVYQPTVTNTNWYIKCKCLTAADMDCTFIFDDTINKITDTPVMVWSGDPVSDMKYHTTQQVLLLSISRTDPGPTTLFKYLNFWTNPTLTGSYNHPLYSWYSPWTNNPVKIGLLWTTVGNSYGVYASSGFNTCVNLTSGQTITVTKTTNDMTFTFTDINDYYSFVNDISAFEASPSYGIWAGLSNLDSRYYASYQIVVIVGDSCGDITSSYTFNFFWGCPITYDNDNQIITITFAYSNK